MNQNQYQSQYKDQYQAQYKDKWQDPCKDKWDPCKDKCDPCKDKWGPCKDKWDPCKDKWDPCKDKWDPCKDKWEPCKDKCEWKQCKCGGPCANYRQQLEESLQDEICDAGFYAQIANEAPTPLLRELITSIVGDEYGHARLQAALLAICPPPISCPPDCPTATGDFSADVEAAIEGELAAIGRYAGLAGCAPTLEIRYLLTSILGDEYAHARIWNAMLLGESLCCKDKPVKDTDK